MISVLRIPIRYYWPGLWLLASLLYSGCAYRDYKEELNPSETGASPITYPLINSLRPGITGSFTLSRLSDGSASGSLSLQGFDPTKRYFANISRSNATNFGSTPIIADLKEVQLPQGTSTTWLKKDYLNHPLKYHSLIVADAMVKVFEFDPSTGETPREVLRGDIGGNLLTSETKTLTIVPIGTSGVQGSVVFTRRVNGNLYIRTELTGLTTGQPATQGIFRGDVSETFTLIKRLDQVSGQTGVGISGLSGYTLAQLDTLKGFFGIGFSPAQPDSIIALGNFGGNTSAGRTLSIPIFNTADSTNAGSVTFTERSGGALRLSWRFDGIPAGDAFFITLHRGFSLEGPNSYYTVKVPVQAGREGSLNRLLLPFSEQGTTVWKDISFDQLDTLNLHLRLTGDTTAFSSTQSIADLGMNRLTGRSLMVPLPDLTGGAAGPQSGYVVIRELKSGHIFFDLSLQSTITLASHFFNIRQGQASATDQGPLLLQVAELLGNGTSLRQQFSPKVYADGTPLTFPSLTSGDAKYLEIEYDLGQPWCAGNIPQ